MAEIINGVSVPFLPIGGVDGLKERSPIEATPERSFDEVFTEELQSLKFSKHAQQRIESSNMNLSNDDLQQLTNAVQKADTKGANESLVLLRDMAFVVNVKNKTVITAIDSDRLKENVFTNIDSAIIAG
jgi:flagellar operon protein